MSYTCDRPQFTEWGTFSGKKPVKLRFVDVSPFVDERGAVPNANCGILTPFDNVIVGIFRISLFVEIFPGW